MNSKNLSIHDLKVADYGKTTYFFVLERISV